MNVFLLCSQIYTMLFIVYYFQYNKFNRYTDTNSIVQIKKVTFYLKNKIEFY